MSDGGMMKLGPEGSRSGKAWDEKGHNKIAQIFISHGDEGINSIQFQYVENGSLKLSERHGYINGCFDAVQLKHATEYITWVSGRRSYHKSGGRVCSIMFGTNLGEYGPFGSFTGQDREFYFKLGGEYSQFGGFHGTADNYTVNSIGLYLNPNVSLDHDVSQQQQEASSLHSFSK